ncbi:ribosome maturation factor RimM [Trinickia mobilis]|uniref:ribosome maturation factor RimM n=1 Tax=Trinickia mobilis TaxID=2816356 RepID=UPI001A8FAB91|nr:ribosome maturation factor RimM [Trinickia mobilis]
MSDRESGGSSRAKGAARARASFGAFVRKPAASAAAASIAPGAESEAALTHVESAETWPDDAVEVGAIVDAYGLKGWVKVAAHADAGHGGDALLSAKRWWLMKGRERKSAAVLQSKPHSDSIVAHLGDSADRDAALALRGCRVHVRRSDFPSLGADEYYWVDLLGLDVVNEAGVALGQVVDMIDNGAHSVLRIEYPATAKDGRAVKGERLIPFVGVYVKTVDRAARQIVVDWEADY